MRMRKMRLRRISAGVYSLLLAVTGLVAAGSDARLPEAAKAGDRDAVSVLLRQGADVNSPAVDGTTALHWAVYRDDREMADWLLDAAADVNVANRYGATPLSLACTNANPEMVERLVMAGADPNAAPSGEPALLTCARTGRVKAVAALLAHGADVNATDSWRGQTALMWAAGENHAASVQLLIERGADVRVTATGTRPRSRGRGDPSLADDRDRFTALFFAAREGSLESARVLVNAGADVNKTVVGGASVLRSAIDTRHYPVAALLLDRGADPNAGDSRGETPLHAAVRARNPAGLRRLLRGTDAEEGLEFIEVLLARGADPNARTVETPRRTDAQAGAAGRPVIDNTLNVSGATPFLLAAQAVDVDAMRLLLAHGADPQLSTYGNTTPLMVAAGVGFLEGRTYHLKPERDVLEAVTLALDAGLEINAVNDRGQTALHGAVYRIANNSVIQLLVDAGARMDQRDELGRTPAELAEHGFLQLASLIHRDSAAELLHKLNGGNALATEARQCPARWNPSIAMVCAPDASGGSR